MKRKTIQLAIATIACLVWWSSCKKDKDLVPLPQPIVNEPEVITTMMLTFIDSSNASNIKQATFRDPDGDGGLGFEQFDRIELEANKTWYTSILLLNETLSPADTISNEVLEEGAEHLFCFTPDGTSVTVSLTDLDENALPVGLQSTWYTGEAGEGTMLIQLKHQPDVKDGSCELGDTDIEVVFQIKIQ
jgi:hypothetical protein